MNKTFALPALAAFAFAALAVTPGSAAAQQVVVVAPPPPPPPGAFGPPPAFWGPPPSTGLGLIVTGSVFTGLGAVNLLTAPICKTSAVAASVSDVCLDASLVAGGIFLVIGIPMLAVGASRRNAYLEWRASHAAATLLDVNVTRVPGGAAATWQTTF